MLRIAPLLLSLVACAPRLPPAPGPLVAMRAHRPASRPPAPADPPPAKRPDRPVRPPPAAPAVDVARAAKALLTGPTPLGYRADCSGFVEATLSSVGRELRGSTAMMWEASDAAGRTHRDPRPQPGDLAFFDDTYDRNGNRRRDDPLTHVAVVVEVDTDGTITLAHDGTSRGRATLLMNLLHPDDLTIGDKAINAPLRARRRGDPDDLPVLASQLWRGFARPP